MKKIKSIIAIFMVTAIFAFFFANIGCEDPFEPASKIESRRFLGIQADPAEATFSEQVRFSALIVNKYGSVFDSDDGDIVWIISGDDIMRESAGADEGNINLNNVWLETELTGPFIWQVPDKQTFTDTFGPLESRGKILTVTAVVFNKGQIDLSNPDFDIDFDMKTNITAFKLFVVSEQPEQNRMLNPQISQVYVTDSDCNEIAVNQNDEYATSRGKVKINVIPEKKNKNLVFSWFTNEDDFEPDFEGYQELKRDGKGLANVYVVLRQDYFFKHDGNVRTRITGINWPDIAVSPQDKVIPVRFK